MINVDMKVNDILFVLVHGLIHMFMIFVMMFMMFFS